jgi:hypothetical protein
MELDVFWHRPVSLSDGRAEGLILTCKFDEIPEAPGVYAFCRMFGESIEPLYIGLATDLRGRVWGHLNGNVRLVHRIMEAKIGPKVVLTGEWKPKPGQRPSKALRLIESALIKYAIAEGHDLLNKQGAKRRVHTVNSSGNRIACKQLFRSSINIEQRD